MQTKHDPYLLVMVLLGIVTAVIFSTSFFSVSELIYPVRIDSVYVRQNTQEYLSEWENYDTTTLPQPLFMPDQLSLVYTDFNVYAKDSIILKGWYFDNPPNPVNITLLIIHDINESKINYISYAREFWERGIRVLLIDMRAHGTSGGEKFYLGMQSQFDVLNILDTLYKLPETENVAIFGKGIGAGIALNAAVLHNRKQSLILQSPYGRLDNYVRGYANDKWGVLNHMLYPISSRKLQREIGVKLSDIKLTEKIKETENPTMIIVAGKDEIVNPEESKKVFIASPAARKEILLVKEAQHDNIDLVEGDAYFNKISIFMVRSFPKQPKKTRFKKLV